MTWYKEGLVSIQSGETTVSGLGTEFLKFVSVGDGIAFMGGTSIYEISHIASDTSLILSQPYTGADLERVNFYCIPILGYDKMLSDSFNLIRLQLEGYLDKLHDLDEWVFDPTREAIEAADHAKASELAAATSETNSKASELAAATSESNSKASELAAATSETNAASSASSAATSETNAASSASSAANSVIEADTAKTDAETAMAGAESARDGAQSNATAAANSATAASTARSGAEAARDAAAISADAAAQSVADAAAVVLDDFGPALHYADSKITPVDADELAVADSEASWSLRKLTWGNLKASVWASFKTIATGGSAQATLGLGTAATRDVGTVTGQVMEVGAFGLGVASGPASVSVPTGAGFYITSEEIPDSDGHGIPSDSLIIRLLGAAGRYIGVKANGSNSVFLKDYNKEAVYFLHTGNTLNIGTTATTARTALNLFADASGVMTNGTGQLSNDMSDFLSSNTFDDMAQKVGAGSGPRPTKDHGNVAVAYSQTVTCNVQESDFHMMSMGSSDAVGTLTIDFSNMPDTLGKHFSWHVRLQCGARKTVTFAQTISWAGGVAPTFGSNTTSQDLMMFYKVGSETIRGMVIDAW